MWGQDITAEFKQWSALLDGDALYREMVECKRTQRWWNFAFDRHAIDSALIWLKRNLEKREDSFRLRVENSDWFYPDFIVWIIDHESRTQTFGFVDPKGLVLGAGSGWADYKIVSTLYPSCAENLVLQDGDAKRERGRRRRPTPPSISQIAS